MPADLTMKIMTVGKRAFVTSFQLAGVPGTITETPEEALESIKKISEDPDVGLVLVGDDVAGPIDDEITQLRTQRSTLVFALPASGGTKIDVDYRAMLKKILGM